MDWTLDLGNSRLKLCEYGPPDARRVELAPEPAPEFDSGQETVLANNAQLLAGLERRLAGRELRGVAFSSVASESRTREIEAWLRQHTSLCVLSCDARLENRTRVPEGVGRDRLFAALGALELAPADETSLIVCDAGTALTVDLVRRAAGVPADTSVELASSFAGSFVGGAIAPGPELLGAALARGGARLFEVESTHAETPAVGRETSEALASGIVHGFRGAARELVAQVAKEAGLDSPLVVVTGGASELLRGVFDESRLLCDPRLVHRGLWAALMAERKRCSNSAN